MLYYIDLYPITDCIIIPSVNLLSFVKSLLPKCTFCITVKLIWNKKLKSRQKKM